MRALWLLAAGCGRIGFGVPDGAVPPDSSAMFVDLFDRADGPLGNSWTEKHAGTFGVTAGHVSRLDFARDYRDNVVYRPPAEDLLDVEVAIEFGVGHLPPGYPQVFARLQRATLGAPNTLDGYILYIDGGTASARITHQTGSVLPPPLATFALAPALDTVDSYRLRLHVTGTAPVQLGCFVEVLAGTTWTPIGQVQTTDSGPTAIVTPGPVGFSAGQPEAAGYYTYRHFAAMAL